MSFRYLVGRKVRSLFAVSHPKRITLGALAAVLRWPEFLSSPSPSLQCPPNVHWGFEDPLLYCEASPSLLLIPPLDLVLEHSIGPRQDSNLFQDRAPRTLMKKILHL